MTLATLLFCLLTAGLTASLTLCLSYNVKIPVLMC